MATATMGWGDQGSTRAWRIRRAKILQRDNHTCRIQLPGCQGVATEVHHTKAWTGRPEDTPAHELQACCGPCNKRAGWATEPTDPEPRPWR